MLFNTKKKPLPTIHKKTPNSRNTATLPEYLFAARHSTCFRSIYARCNQLFSQNAPAALSSTENLISAAPAADIREHLDRSLPNQRQLPARK